MSAKNDLTIPLLPDRYYHIFNRGINRQAIFFNDGNYTYFLRKFGEKISGYANTFAYCLLENHFHLFIRPLRADEILTKASTDFEVVNAIFMKDYVLPWTIRVGLDTTTLVDAEKDLTNFKNLVNLYNRYGDTQSNPDPQPSDLSSSDFKDQFCSWIISERIRGFMLGYAKAINKQQQRTGSLLQKGFRRKYVPDSDFDKKRVLFYIHHNPIHHFYTDNYEDYAWSSYNTYLTDKQTRICRNESLEWFGSKENYIDFGEHYKNNRNYDDKWIINED